MTTNVIINFQKPVTARTVADLCGVDMKTVHRWADEKRLPWFRTPGGHYRFRPSEVVAFMRNMEQAHALTDAHLKVLVAARSATRARTARGKVKGLEEVRKLLDELWTQERDLAHNVQHSIEES